MLHRLFRPLALLIVALISSAGPGAAAQGSAVAQRITIASPASGTQVGSPVVVTGRVAYRPAAGSLQYTILASDGRTLGTGNFTLPGGPGEPTAFVASLTFTEPPEGDTISLQLADQNPTTGSLFAVVALSLTVVPVPPRIIIETPAAGVLVGNPVVVTGRTTRFPATGVLGYAIYNNTGTQVGGSVFPVTGNAQTGGRFNASLNFLYPEQGGLLRIDLYAQDSVTGAFLATTSLQVRTTALRQQVTLETPAPGTQVGSPVVLTGRVARYPVGGMLHYRLSDSKGSILGTGDFPVVGSVGDAARFVASFSFTPPAANGPLQVEIFELDERGNVTANGLLALRWGP